MITEWSVYWILKLDSISGLFIGFTCCFAGFAFFSMMGWFINAGEDCISKALSCKKRFYISALIAGLLAVPTCLIPTTKQMAMIKVIPAIANSEEVKQLRGDAKELYDLGIEAAKEYLSKKTENEKVK